MIGLVYLLFFALYLLISAYVIYRATLYARRKYNKGWVGGWLAAFLMYNLVFWDWIPVVVAHKYYCEKDAGFWVYKTPEQWFKENPEAKGKLWGDDYYDSKEKHQNGKIPGGRRYWSSDYLMWDVLDGDVFHSVGRQERRLIDAYSGETLARMVNYYRGSGSGIALGARDLTTYKIWLSIGARECTPREQELTNKFGEFKNEFIHIGGEEK